MAATEAVRLLVILFVLALPLNLSDRSLLMAGTYAVVLLTLILWGLSLRVVLNTLGFTRRVASGERCGQREA